jgi:hypothetical protein
MRRAAAVLAVALLIGPSAQLRGGASLGVVEGFVTLGGHAFARAEIALVNLDSGAVQRVTTGADGAFEAHVVAGRYALTTEGRAGLAVARAPRVVNVAAAQVASTRVELVALPVAFEQEAAPAAGAGETPRQPGPEAVAGQAPPVVGARIDHEPVGCFIAGEFPLLDAKIEPATGVARARAYFKGARGNDYFYVEGAATEGQFIWKLPRPTLAASPITYYIWAATAELDESRTPEIQAIVVREASDCPSDRKLAAIGPPGEVTIYSAATGTVMAPVGFAAGSLALTVGTAALVLSSAAATGITAVVTVFNPQPTPTMTPVPTPTVAPTVAPTPTATPTPQPSASPTASPTPGSPFR